MLNLSVKSLVVLLLVPFTVFANNSSGEYHYDASLGYARNDSNSIDSNLWGASVNYYWNPITYQTNNPNKESAFVNRLGTVGILYLGQVDDSRSVDFHANGLNASLVYAAKDFNHVFELGYDWSRLDFDFNNTSDIHSFDLGYQYYLLDNLTIGGGFRAAFFDDANRRRRAEKYSYKLETKYLLGLGNENWVSLNALYSFTDDENSFNDFSHVIQASAEYYFNPITSLKVGGGGVFTKYQNGGSRDTGFLDTALHHYFTEQFVANIGFKNTFGNNVQQYSVGVNFLF